MDIIKNNPEDLGKVFHKLKNINFLSLFKDIQN